MFPTICAVCTLRVEQWTMHVKPYRLSTVRAPTSYGSEVHSSSWGKAQAESRQQASTIFFPTGWRGITGWSKRKKSDLRSRTKTYLAQFVKRIGLCGHLCQSHDILIRA